MGGSLALLCGGGGLVRRLGTGMSAHLFFMAPGRKNFWAILLLLWTQHPNSTQVRTFT